MYSNRYLLHCFKVTGILLFFSFLGYVFNICAVGILKGNLPSSQGDFFCIFFVALQFVNL